MVPFSIRTLIGGACTAALGIPALGVGTASAAQLSAPAAPPSTAAARLPAQAAGAPVRAPGPQTLADLEQSMRGEAFANASYRLYAEQARRQGLTDVARAFDRAAGVELNDHYKKESDLAGVVGSNAANLRAAMAGENYESRQMYPGFARQARSAGDTAAATRFSEIGRDEATHRDAFGTALRVVQTGKGKIPAAPAVHPVKVPAGPAQVRGAQTAADLDTAIHGEALAHAKYGRFAQHAEQTGDPALARLFRGSSDVELKEHLAEQARLAGLVGTTRANLTKAISGERYESQTMYPGFAKQAKAAGDTEAARVFAHNARDEAAHARHFQRALNELPAENTGAAATG